VQNGVKDIIMVVGTARTPSCPTSRTGSGSTPEYNMSIRTSKLGTAHALSWQLVI
jgi:dTDP-glucose pyrophosphorylase